MILKPSPTLDQDMGAIWDGPNRCYQLEHKCLVDLIPFSSMAIKGSVAVPSKIMLTVVTCPVFWELGRNQELCTLFTNLQLSLNLFSWLCLSFPTEKKHPQNRMRKILCKTHWNFFYLNYNHVILNHMARVGWCADFSMFLTFSHPKRVWKDKSVISFQKGFPENIVFWRIKRKHTGFGLLSSWKTLSTSQSLQVKLGVFAHYFTCRPDLSSWVCPQNIILINKSH